MDIRRELHRFIGATRHSTVGPVICLRKLGQERIRSVFVLVLWYVIIRHIIDLVVLMNSFLSVKAYDVGDRMGIDGETVIISKINLLSTYAYTTGNIIIKIIITAEAKTGIRI